MEQVSIIHPGMVRIIIQDPGRGDSILLILPISAGDLAGVIARAGSVSGLVTDTDMGVTVMATEVADGGVRLFIILPVGVGGMAPRGLMDSTEIISTYIITYT